MDKYEVDFKGLVNKVEKSSADDNIKLVQAEGFEGIYGNQLTKGKRFISGTYVPSMHDYVKHYLNDTHYDGNLQGAKEDWNKQFVTAARKWRTYAWREHQRSKSKPNTDGKPAGNDQWKMESKLKHVLNSMAEKAEVTRKNFY